MLCESFGDKTIYNKIIDSFTALISRQRVEDIFPVTGKGQRILWWHLCKILIS